MKQKKVVSMMKCDVVGRKQTILQLLQRLKAFGYCTDCSVQYPEAFKFCRGSDITNICINSSCNFLDFSILKERSFRCLEITLKLNHYLFQKKRGYQKILMTEKPNFKKEVIASVASDVTDVFDQETDLYEIGEYETLELFEERVRKRNDNKRFYG